MSSTRPHKYVVMATAYDYDDQNYYAQDGGDPALLYPTAELAEAEAKRRYIRCLRESHMEGLYEGNNILDAPRVLISVTCMGFHRCGGIRAQLLHKCNLQIYIFQINPTQSRKEVVDTPGSPVTSLTL
jgi:hypothetical protein